MIPALIPLFVLVPLFAFLICSFLPNHWEKRISSLAIFSTLAVLVLFLITAVFWGEKGFAPLAQSGMTLFSSAHYVFSFDFYMDLTSVVFFSVTCLITLFVFLFSRYYMHRDPGFKRFYATLLFFFMGLALILFAGNFETLFVGWEVIGISSFLLIAFYRNRFLPTKNGLKVFSLYRIADALFIVALWYAHHLFEHNIHFTEFASLIGAHGNALVGLGVLFLCVALIKSAQFPFSYWLPRAMEGPTTSSAIFYGALSVHIGLFLLMRTFPLWEGSMELRVAIAVLGLITALVATSIARVQSSIKTQIAYASVTQIGIMFIELALGLHWLLLLHFVSNASLRTYQLLISPSILSYWIHYQFYTFVRPVHKMHATFMGKIRTTLFILGIKEWNMDSTMSHLVWQPLKRMGQFVRFLDSMWASVVCMLIFLGGVYASTYTGPNSEMLTTSELLLGVTWVSGILSLLLLVRAFTTKRSPRVCWNLIFLAQLFMGLFLTVLSEGTGQTVLLYGSGILAAFVVGHICLFALGKKAKEYTLVEFHGQMYTSPLIGTVFFLACLAMMMFPITTSFLGEELLLSMIRSRHVVEMVIFAVGYVLAGVCVLRLFAKLFFGPHTKTYHEIAYLSS